MTEQVNVHDAKTRLSQLLARVEAGEEIIIARNGQPVARLTAVDQPQRTRTLGRDEGLFEVPEDFNAPLPQDVLDAFEG